MVGNLRAGGGAYSDLNRIGVIKIAKGKRIDWPAIQAEYIGGNIGQKRLAKKHGVAYGSLRKRAETEGWYALKKEAIREAGVKAAQKTAEASAENAVVAARIKAKLLGRLERLTDAALAATEVRTYDPEGNLTEINRLRDLTAAYKDLTGDMPKADACDDALQRAREILGGIDSAIE